MHIDILLFQLTLVLALAMAVYFKARRHGRPAINMRIISGIFISPLLMILVFGEVHLLDSLAQIGLIIILLLIVLEPDSSKIRTRCNIVIATGGGAPWTPL